MNSIRLTSQLLQAIKESGGIGSITVKRMPQQNGLIKRPPVFYRFHFIVKLSLLHYQNRLTHLIRYRLHKQ